MRKRTYVWGTIGILIALINSMGCDRFQPPKSAETDTPAATASETAGATAAIALTAPKVAETQIIARVNDLAITRQDFRRRTEELRAFGVDWKTLPSADKETLRAQLLEDLVRTELMARDSVAYGALRDNELLADLWYMLRAILARTWVDRQQKAVRITQPEIEAFYNTQKELYKVPARLRVRQIVLRTEAEARQMLQQLLGGADFAALAKAQSIAETASKGGEVGWVVRKNDQELYSRVGQALEGEALFESAESVVFALEENGISQVVKGPGMAGAPEAYYIFQVAQKQPSREKSLTEVQDEVKALLTLQKLNEQIGELRKKAQVQTYPDRLKEE